MVHRDRRGRRPTRFAEVDRRTRRMLVPAVAITASPRSEFGKGAARKLRRAGQIPAVIYGSGAELVHVTLPAHELGLALRTSRVVFTIDYAGALITAKPRDVQRDPVRRVIEHIDLIIITKEEAAERGAIGDAIRATEAAATEAGMDPAAAVAAMEDAIAHGESASDAADHALSDVREKAEEYSEANAHAAEATAEAPAEGA
ncbi:MAG: 50S ribosomal protein L25 [Actinobacteria bacterium]|nr:50S ribosomal protein L25 [Actinomycetota bacterium]